MTERGRRRLARDRSRLSIGPSSLAWEGGVLTIRFDEMTSPTPSRLRGTVRLHPQALASQGFDLSGREAHLWRPVAPRADVEVQVEAPAVRWRGEAYFDTNCGAEPLEAGFDRWEWSRAHVAGETRVFYDWQDRSGERRGLSLRYDREARAEPVAAPPSHPLPSTFWGMARHPRIEAPDAMRRRPRTLEDSPFYARTALRAPLDGSEADIVHESLSLRRFSSPLVRAVLPVRMPRIPW